MTIPWFCDIMIQTTQSEKLQVNDMIEYAGDPQPGIVPYRGKTAGYSNLFIKHSRKENEYEFTETHSVSDHGRSSLRISRSL